MTADDDFTSLLTSRIADQREAMRRDVFPSGEIRKSRLRRAIALLTENRDAIVNAVSADFGHRSRAQTLIADILAPVQSLRFAIEHLDDWMRASEAPGSQPGSIERLEHVPIGVVGVIGPWNFPYHLIFEPLAGVLAAGNRAVLKPSELTPRSTSLMQDLVARYFAPEEVTVVQGGADEARAFTAADFDHIIFTGSTPVGRHVMRTASERLVPVTLELGGKSPVIVAATADVEEAAARILTGKTFNAGQICLAPDYVLVARDVYDEFVAACESAVRSMYPRGMADDDYTTVISDRHFRRLADLVDEAADHGANVMELLPGGRDPEARRFPPTLVLNAANASRLMKEEIFGPVLPIRAYDRIDEALDHIRARPHPLALYYFGRDESEKRIVLDGSTSGGVTINDVVAHVLAEGMPFGGVGESGMGAYHGRTGFLTFSHARTIYTQSDAVEAAMLTRPPYGPEHMSLIEAVLAG